MKSAASIRDIRNSLWLSMVLSSILIVLTVTNSMRVIPEPFLPVGHLYGHRSFEHSTKRRKSQGTGGHMVLARNSIEEDPSRNPASASKQSNAIAGINSSHQRDMPPPLESLVMRDQVTGDVQFLLDFVIVGFAKCGTTALIDWLRRHEQVGALEEENWSLIQGNVTKLVRRLHGLYQKQRREQRRRGLPQAAKSNRTVEDNNTSLNESRGPEDNITRTVIGYKQTKDVYMNTTHLALREYFPRTKLIVAIRHPVLWFESYLNFRRHRGPGRRNKHSLFSGIMGRRGILPRVHFNPLQASLGHFHLWLSRLGKTRQNVDPNEWALLAPYYKQEELALVPAPVLPNPIFLLDMQQIADSNETQKRQLQMDLLGFLGLDTNNRLPSFEQVLPESKHLTTDQLQQHRQSKISICDARYDSIRSNLVKIGEDASKWILRYFLNAPDVYVSSPDYFDKILHSWATDPCRNRVEPN